MVDFSLNITTGSGCPVVITGIASQLDLELDQMGISWMRPPLGGYVSRGPIQEVKAQQVRNRSESSRSTGLFPGRYQGLKPLWVKAEIWKSHLGTGETTGQQRQLSEVIRRRGILSDQCGHIIAFTIGGKMIDINLFPQNNALNCGWKGNYFIWKGVETCIKLWVAAIPEQYRPRVQFQMLLYYTNSTYPDRPEKFKYALRFLMDADNQSKGKKEEQEVISVAQVILNVAQISLQCTSTEVLMVKEKIKVAIAQVTGKYKKHLEDFLAEWSAIILEIEKPSPVVPRASFRDRPRSFWNFVPFVGSVKNIIEGIEDVSDGYSTSGVMNLVIGGAGLTLDVFTLGTISTLVNSVGGTVAKEVGKEIVKEVGKEVVKEAGKTVAKEAGKEIAKEAAVATAKQAVSAIVMQTGGKVATTYGVAQVAKVLIRV